MARSRRIALFIDVDNVKIGKEAVEELFDQLNTNGEVVYCKFYGYNDRKHLYLSDFISNYGYETAPFMRLKKRYSQLDNRIIVDAVRVNYTKPDIDTFCIVAGDGDLIPLLVELKSCGKTVIDVNTEYQELNAHMFDEHVYLRSIGKGVETYTSKTKKAPVAKKAPAKKPAPVAAKPAPAPKRPAQPARRPEPVYEDDYDYDYEEPQYEEPAPRRPQPRPQPAPVQTQTYTRPAPAKPAPAPVEDDYDDFFDDVAPVTKPTPAASTKNTYVDEDQSIVNGDYDLSEVLKDITNRYNNLDLSSNDAENMNEKLRLIRDIENLIESENSKGEGIYSDNEDIRQIFTDLQDVVDDMKNAL